MARLGVFGVPGSQGLLRDVDEALRVAAQVGYPVLLKATAGGGGKGMRVCRGPEDLPQAFEQARLEAEKAFGNGGLYAERFVEGGRHIELQVMADRYGRVVHFGERECSTQRSNQKLIEEAPSACVSAAQRDEVGRRLCEAISRMGYVGAGTVEFLRAPTGELFFMEMNTRLQVEHPVTELVTGVDLVELQLRMAAGEPLRLKQEDIAWRGHAVECRINAEDPAHNFRPSPGTLTGFGAPEAWRYNFEGPVRLDSHARAGYRIPTFYDSMIGKLIAWGPDRASAIARLSSALGQLHIEGVPTTVPLHEFLLQDAGFLAGEYSMASMGEAMRRFMASREA
jgi:acetyl-CoA carboxylase biotin carboxylase subunit